uniref:Beta-parvin-like isoform X3 n=1 Tax=Petromyzon marinus TaxID=7757 RepID=A0AAJ7TDE7_PETMA|nr:beta-parvin-like isoform X3 [Petromyzon marinus]
MGRIWRGQVSSGPILLLLLLQMKPLGASDVSPPLLSTPPPSTPRTDGRRERRSNDLHNQHVAELQEEAMKSTGSALSPTSEEISQEGARLEENEERSIINPQHKDDPKLQELIKVLKDWINDVLVEDRIIVKDLEDDLYDGQVLQKLLVIHSKHVVAILHLLVALAIHFRAPIHLPDHVTVQLVVVQKRGGKVLVQKSQEVITTTMESMAGHFERDAFDTLFDHAPDKLNVVKKSLITFVNKHLSKLNLEVTELETQFADGVYLVLLMGLVEGYFVPLYNFFLTPDGFEQKVHNVSFSFELMQDGGLCRPKARPEDIVNFDLKSTLRVLYNLFTKYKHLE